MTEDSLEQWQLSLVDVRHALTTEPGMEAYFANLNADGRAGAPQLRAAVGGRLDSFDLGAVLRIYVDPSFGFDALEARLGEAVFTRDARRLVRWICAHPDRRFAAMPVSPEDGRAATGRDDLRVCVGTGVLAPFGDVSVVTGSAQ